MQRYSLRTTLVAIGVIALSLGIVLLQIRNSGLRREVEMLRAEMGFLVPVDVSRVNVIEVPTTDQFSWSWRVFAPPGTQFDAGIVTEDIPKRGAPSASFLGIEIPSEPNGVLITASVTNDLDAGYMLQINFGNGNTVRDRISLSREEFINGSASLETAGRSGPQVCKFDEPIILHRRRLYEQTSPTTHSEPEGVSRGLMFWITPKKKP
ncbi:hypothetical protein [Novipirellula rosea]|uniref:Uncharacterized protein n=1 Tax=Novipirellula rosea TaxID=1031540 RepID=A0ABP8N8Z2_9BACT|tara:strand:- start:7469 stop:8092 length:624 start_codon:yes stop_codon:yes gene_type:complete